MVVFIVCLVGLVVFGYFGDCIGCKVILVVVLLIMGLFMVLIGLLLMYV